MLHQPVLLLESINGLVMNPDGIYIDGTFGYGGHSDQILGKLSKHGRLLAFDKDPAAITYGREHFANNKQIQLLHSSFANIASVAQRECICGGVAGILLDLGVSSPQLDAPERGFSFVHHGPLDMRMDSSQTLTAKMFINTASIEEMAFIFKQYGEERFALRIAKAIVRARNVAAINTTQNLAELIKQSNPHWERHKHPATRVFQAIRIHVNQELEELKTFLATVLDVLAPGGRLVIISFHSLEDRLVKNFMRNQSQEEYIPRCIPINPGLNNIVLFKPVGKAIKPGSDEVANNIRSRSAILRIGEKTP